MHFQRFLPTTEQHTSMQEYWDASSRPEFLLISRLRVGRAAALGLRGQQSSLIP